MNTDTARALRLLQSGHCLHSPDVSKISPCSAIAPKSCLTQLYRSDRRSLTATFTIQLTSVRRQCWKYGLGFPQTTSSEWDGLMGNQGVGSMGGIPTD